MPSMRPKLKRNLQVLAKKMAAGGIGGAARQQPFLAAGSALVDGGRSVEGCVLIAHA
ncbi:MAG: hypothetical protein JWL90_2720 [Chthoniobacteraceae bacterium]|nr:hypothetical protein [Chthoniobacteraceae bacterium]